MKKRGLTGLETTETCFAASCDIMTPEANVSAYTYRQYAGVMRHWATMDRRGTAHKNAVLKELYGLIASDLGGHAIGDWTFAYAHTARDLAGVLSRLRERGLRIIIDIVQRSTEVHSVGLKPLDGGQYLVKGYGIPAPLWKKPVTATDIHPFLYESGYNTNPCYPFVGSNVVGLPRPQRKLRTRD